jgi:hypothetical protein
VVRSTRSLPQMAVWRCPRGDPSVSQGLTAEVKGRRGREAGVGVAWARLCVCLTRCACDGAQVFRSGRVVLGGVLPRCGVTIEQQGYEALGYGGTVRILGLELTCQPGPPFPSLPQLVCGARHCGAAHRRHRGSGCHHG